jgi:hypothetical protein
MICATAKTAQVDHNSDDQYKQIKSRWWLTSIYHPRVRESRERKKDEADQWQKQTMIGPLQVC